MGETINSIWLNEWTFWIRGLLTQCSIGTTMKSDCRRPMTTQQRQNNAYQQMTLLCLCPTPKYFRSLSRACGYFGGNYLNILLCMQLIPPTVTTPVCPRLDRSPLRRSNLCSEIGEWLKGIQIEHMWVWKRERKRERETGVEGASLRIRVP